MGSKAWLALNQDTDVGEVHHLGAKDVVFKLFEFVVPIGFIEVAYCDAANACEAWTLFAH